MTNLEQLLRRLDGLAIQGEFWIDGSFLTGKPEPGDVDLTLRLDSETLDSASQPQLDAIEWVHGNLKDELLCDSYVFVEYPAGHPNHDFGQRMHSYWLSQWGFGRKDEPKGIAMVRVPLVSA